MGRHQKRTAAANEGASPLQPEEEIPLSRPWNSGRNRSRSKTLLEVAKDRQRQVSRDATGPLKAQSRSQAPIPADHAEDNESGQSSSYPILDTLFLALPLSCVKFTLSVLTAHQYAQTLQFQPLVVEVIFVTFPFFCLLIHFCHGHLMARRERRAITLVPPILFQLGYLIGANLAGCYLIQLTNDGSYYAVMKRAPAVGTLWVWTVLELGLFGAIGGVAGPALYAWYCGYGFY